MPAKPNANPVRPPASSFESRTDQSGQSKPNPEPAVSLPPAAALVDELARIQQQLGGSQVASILDLGPVDRVQCSEVFRESVKELHSIETALPDQPAQATDSPPEPIHLTAAEMSLLKECLQDKVQADQQSQSPQAGNRYQPLLQRLTSHLAESLANKPASEPAQLPNQRVAERQDSAEADALPEIWISGFKIIR